MFIYILFVLNIYAVTFIFIYLMDHVRVLYLDFSADALIFNPEMPLKDEERRAYEESRD